MTLVDGVSVGKSTVVVCGRRWMHGLVAQPAGLMLGFAVHLVTSAALGGVLF